MSRHALWKCCFLHDFCISMRFLNVSRIWCVRVRHADYFKSFSKSFVMPRYVCISVHTGVSAVFFLLLLLLFIIHLYSLQHVFNKWAKRNLLLISFTILIRCQFTGFFIPVNEIEIISEVLQGWMDSREGNTSDPNTHRAHSLSSKDKQNSKHKTGFNIHHWPTGKTWEHFCFSDIITL